MRVSQRFRGLGVEVLGLLGLIGLIEFAVQGCVFDLDTDACTARKTRKRPLSLTSVRPKTHTRF